MGLEVKRCFGGQEVAEPGSPWILTLRQENVVFFCCFLICSLIFDEADFDHSVGNLEDSVKEGWAAVNYIRGIQGARH